MNKFFRFISICLALLISACTAIPSKNSIRVASFNIAMGLSQEWDLFHKLEDGEDPGLKSMAAILQTVRPDVILINEFDYDPRSAGLLQTNYLSIPQGDRSPVSYDHSFVAPVNTGVDSGLDLDSDGMKGGPNDAWGFGRFPGQYGMLVLSRFPLDETSIRTFRRFLWKDMPEAARPVKEDGTGYYPDEVWQQLRLSSKSHWDVPVTVGKKTLHVLASHPTPPVFDGAEDRNGRRNHDEIRLWADYISTGNAYYLYDDNGKLGGIEEGSQFVIVGDQNSDPHDGDSFRNAIRLLTDHPEIDSRCLPSSSGALQAALMQGGQNTHHTGNPASDTGDFSDNFTGNLRIDYALPSKNLSVRSCGVFWPEEDDRDHELIGFTDHRLVWVDVNL
jgi:hypothetical protein